MTNKLINKLGLAGIILAGALAFGGCKEYNIDGNKIIKADFVGWELKEIKPTGEEIVYFNDQVKIIRGFFNERCYSYPSNIFLEAQKRINYFNHKIDSIENVKKLNDLKLLKK